MKRRASCGLLAVLVLVPAWAPAQMEPGAPPEPTPARSPAPSRGPGVLIGLAGVGGIPLDHFGDVAGTGSGPAVYLTLAPRRQPLGLRLEVSILEYGSETIDATVADTGGRVKTDRIRLQVTTRNDFTRFALGPQVTARSGRLRPYAYATAGASYFSTTSYLDDDSYNADAIASTTNCSDWTFSWNAGGGVLAHIAGPLILELGVRYLANLPVDWLAEGDLAHDPTGPARPQPRHSAVNLVEIVVGLALAF